MHLCFPDTPPGKALWRLSHSAFPYRLICTRRCLPEPAGGKQAQKSCSTSRTSVNNMSCRSEQNAFAGIPHSLCKSAEREAWNRLAFRRRSLVRFLSEPRQRQLERTAHFGGASARELYPIPHSAAAAYGHLRDYFIKGKDWHCGSPAVGESRGTYENDIMAARESLITFRPFRYNHFS